MPDLSLRAPLVWVLKGRCDLLYDVDGVFGLRDNSEEYGEGLSLGYTSTGGASTGLPVYR